ncbi:MAG: hypothetical protein K6C36_07080 [Clostridia bacterium]|nr:hypothetical protein [Clostridia bacterium]
MDDVRKEELDIFTDIDSFLDGLVAYDANGAVTTAGIYRSDDFSAGVAVGENARYGAGTVGRGRSQAALRTAQTAALPRSAPAVGYPTAPAGIPVEPVRIKTAGDASITWRPFRHFRIFEILTDYGLMTCIRYMIKGYDPVTQSEKDVYPGMDEPSRKERSGAAALHAIVKTVKWAAVFTAVLSFFYVGVRYRLEKLETSKEIAALEEQLDAYRSQEAYIASALASRFTHDEIADYAQNYLGMVRCTADHKIYVDTSLASGSSGGFVGDFLPVGYIGSQDADAPDAAAGAQEADAAAQGEASAGEKPASDLLEGLRSLFD